MLYVTPPSTPALWLIPPICADMLALSPAKLSEGIPLKFAIVTSFEYTTIFVVFNPDIRGLAELYSKPVAFPLKFIVAFEISILPFDAAYKAYPSPE